MHTEICVVTADEKAQIWKTYNLNQHTIDEAVDMLVTWYNQQPHLPECELDRAWVERVFVANKCSMERTKEKIDMAFAGKNIMPEFFQDWDPIKQIQDMKGILQFTPLPKLHKDNSRLVVVRPVKNDAVEYDIDNFFKYAFLVCRYLQSHDYAVGIRLIYDTKYLTMNHIVRMYPGSMRNGEMAFKKVFGTRLPALHIVNTNAFLEKVMFVLKSALKPKLASRIVIHSTIGDLHKHIDKDLLPSEYGGSLKSYDDFTDDLHKELCQPENLKWFRKLDTLKSDESKRSNRRLDDEFLGVAGSFRALKVD